MTATSPAETTALAISSASAGALLLHENSMERLERIADLMASGKTTVPQHLRGSKGDCFAITLQSMQWGMNPFAVAQKTHLVSGTLGYEAQLVAAVVNSSGAVKDRFHFEWFGDWEKIVGKFKTVESKTKKDDNGEAKKYIVPDWKPEDERGLGVKVWATLKGESTPRELQLLLTQARTRNSTLWTEDPKQQIAYLAQKRWSRLYAPDVILGVYTPDELAEPGERFMGAADVVGAPPPPSAPVTYPEADFTKNLPAWRKVIESGRKTPDEIIALASTKHPLTDEQKAQIKEIQPPPPPAPAPAGTDPDTGEISMTHAQVSSKLHAAAGNVEKLAEAGSLISLVQNEQYRKELTALYDQLVAAAQ